MFTFKVAGHLAVAQDAEGLHAPTTASVELVGDTLRIELFESTAEGAEVKSHTIDLDPALVLERPDICAGYIGRDLGIQLVWDTERFNTRDAGSSVADRKSVPDVADSKFVAGFTDTGCYVVICAPLKQIPVGVQFEERQHNNAPRDWLAAQEFSLYALVKRNRAKRAALAHLKPLDSIAELEKQVDLLSDIVFRLVANAPMPDWLEGLLEVTRTHSSVRSESEALQDISKHKATVRAIQQDYFESRSVSNG